MNKTKIRNAVRNINDETYIGNPFYDELRNINDEMDRASEEFSKLFDYGKERSDSL